MIMFELHKPISTAQGGGVCWQRLVSPFCAHLSKQTHAKVCAVVSLLASLRTNSSPPAIANRSTTIPPISNRIAPNSSTTKHAKITQETPRSNEKAHAQPLEASVN